MGILSEDDLQELAVYLLLEFTDVTEEELADVYFEIDDLVDIIKEMGEFFDLDIPELNKTKVDLEKYNIKSIDTKDYSNTPRKIYIIIGGMGKSFSEQIQEECAQNCLNILMEIIEENEIDRVENGFIVQTPVQNIPNISNELINNNISIYGIIPIE